MRDYCYTPDSTKDVQVKLLHEACLKLGGEHHLAHRLGVSVESIERWLMGHSPVPDAVFLACLDIVRPDQAA